MKTGSDGLVRVNVIPGEAEGVYVIEAMACDAVGRGTVRVVSGE